MVAVRSSVSEAWSKTIPKEETRSSLYFLDRRLIELPAACLLLPTLRPDGYVCMRASVASWEQYPDAE